MIHKNNVIFKLSERPELQGKFGVAADNQGEYFIYALKSVDPGAEQYSVKYICDERQEAANIVKLLGAAKASKERAAQAIAEHMDKQAVAIIDQYIHTANNIKEMMQ